MGQRPCLCLPVDWPRMQGLYGPYQLRPEALQKTYDAGLGRKLRRKPEQRNKRRQKNPQRIPKHPRLTRYRHQRSSRTNSHRHNRPNPLFAWKRLKPRYAASDNHRPGSQSPARTRRRKESRYRHRLRGRRLKLRRTFIPVRHRQNQRRKYQNYTRRAELLPDRLLADHSHTTSATRQELRHCSRCTQSAIPLSPLPFTRAACVITVWPLSSVRPQSKDCSNQRHIRRPNATRRR